MDGLTRLRFSPGVRAALSLALAGLAACAPTLERGCKSDDDCAAGQTCAAGHCAGPSMGADLGAGGGGSGGGGAGGGGARADAGPDLDARPSADARTAETGQPFPDLGPPSEAGKPLPDGGPPADAGPPPPDATPPSCPLPEGATVPPEICNGFDDDCDGTIDVDPAGAPLARTCWAGSEETRGVGVCRDGVQLCDHGEFGTCNGQVLPSAEICDALDNDCDLAIDEDPQGGPFAQACYSGPPGTAGTGICTFGAQICRNGLLGPCIGETLPGLEICDGGDNDCNGEPDDVADSEDCGACEPGAVRTCYAGAPETLGVGTCQAGEQQCNDLGAGWGSCEGQSPPVAESCDGLDNDCDGLVDDEVPGVGDDCVLGVGACATVGVQACEGAGLVCQGFLLEPLVERCNGLDDDCDGLTDEEFALGRPCTSGLGACQAAGETVCGADAAGVICDAVAGQAGTEDCNGLDDDCDGEVDEPEPGDDVLERRCYTGAAGTEDVGPCRGGRQRCASPAWSACVDETTPWPEICDGVDNDCDGRVDDGLGGDCVCHGEETQACYTGPAGTVNVGVCRPGSQTCESGHFGSCTRERTPSAETCNGEDDDCNGRDDDVPGVGDDCSVGVGQCRRAGSLDCDNDAEALVCDASPGQARAETCNGLDDDCDGRTDEDFALGTACTAGVGACARPGVIVCAAGVAACDAVPGNPGRETCDNQDNDCDGVIDNEASNQCPAQPGASAVCAAGRCRYQCNAHTFDGDANLDNGCERGCGPSVAGQLIAQLSLRTGVFRYDSDLSVVTDAAGTAAVAYVQSPVGGLVSDLTLFTTGQNVRLSPGNTGAYLIPVMTHIGGRWVAFANHTTTSLPLASEERLDVGIATPNGGAYAVTTQTWPRLGSAIPGVGAYWNGERPVAVAYVVSTTADWPNAGRLQSRVVDVADASLLDDGPIGDFEDFAATETRLLGFPLANGTAVAAQTLNAEGVYGMRFLIVSPQGAVVAHADSPSPLPAASPDFAGALTNGGGTFAHIAPDTGHLTYWRLTIGPNADPELTAFDTDIDDAASVSVVYGRAGPILFFRHGTALRALFLDAQHRIVGDLPNVVVPPAERDALGVVRVSSNGVRLNAAWVVRPDLGAPEQLRMAQLNCQ